MTFSTAISGRRLMVWLSALGLVTLSACGGSDDGEARYSVSGTVTYQGVALDHGDIIFTPADIAKGRAASSTIESGSYTLSTLGYHDGALPGQYKVTVTSRDIDLSQIKPKAGKSKPDPALIGKAMREAKHLTPKKYEVTDTSPLTAEVKPQSNSFKFELVD